MKKIIGIDNQITARLRRFSEEGDFSVFLDAIEYALAKKRYTCDKFEEAWSSFSNCRNLNGLLDKFAPLLAKIEIVEKKDTIPSHPLLTKEEASEVLRLTGDMFKEEDDLRKRFESTYSWFQPSWQLGEVLNNHYPEDLNPGIVIGKYINMLFPCLPEHDYRKFMADYTYQPVYKLAYGSALHIFLKKLASELVHESTIFEKYKKAADVIVGSILDAKSEELTTKEQVEEYLIAGLLLPRDIFFSWYYWSSYMSDDMATFGCTNEVFPHALKILFSYFSIGQGNRPISGNIIGSCSIPWKSVDEKVLSYNTLSDLFRTYRDLECYDNFDEELTLLVSKILSNYNYFRLNHLSGMSPINEDSAVMIIDRINWEEVSIPMDDIDLTIFLSAGFWGHYGHDAINLVPNPEESEDLFVAYEKKKNIYFCLYRKANNEGLPELANALLSLYIMGRAINCKCRMGNLGELKTLLDEATRIPGSMIVEHTIQTLVSFIDDYFPTDPVAKLTGFTFLNCIRKKGTLYPLQTRKKDTPATNGVMKKCESRLIGLLGEECWDKLSNDSKGYLVTAQSQWELCAPEFCFSIKDWSGIVNPYFKAIELELTTRLEPLYSSREYSNYLREDCSGKKFTLTLGWAIRILKDHKILPVACQKILYKAPLKTYENGKLVRALRSLAEDRNLSAHKKPYTMVKYSELMQSLFDKKLLVNFISTLE